MRFRIVHYALNSIENARFRVERGDWRTRLARDLSAKLSAGVEAGVARIMSAYNSVKGDYFDENQSIAHRATGRLEISQVSATYVGDLSKNGKELKGVWSEGKDHNLRLKRLADSAELERPVPMRRLGRINRRGWQTEGVYLHISKLP